MKVDQINNLSAGLNGLDPATLPEKPLSTKITKKKGRNAAHV
jgi:hypothetical protein